MNRKKYKMHYFLAVVCKKYNNYWVFIGDEFRADL